MCTSYCNSTLKQSDIVCHFRVPVTVVLNTNYSQFTQLWASILKKCRAQIVFPCCVTVRPTLSGDRYVSLTVNSGETLTFPNFDVIGGYPTPKVTWYKGDAEIPSGAPSSATAADAGRYKVVAENEAGSDVHYVDVDVSIAGNSCFI